MKARDVEEGFADLLGEAETQASTDWEMNFVADIKSRFEEYGDDTFVSEKQLDKLKAIASGENSRGR